MKNKTLHLYRHSSPKDFTRAAITILSSQGGVPKDEDVIALAKQMTSVACQATAPFEIGTSHGAGGPLVVVHPFDNRIASEAAKQQAIAAGGWMCRRTGGRHK